MKANELMIGDWVMNTEFGKNEIRQVEIIESARCWLVGGRTYVPLVDIEPIPLTHDIIKANGFELTEVGDNGIATPRKDLNRYEKHECKTKWRDITMWYDRMTKKWCLHGINSIQLNYVHELQHALKICGIDKEITI